MGGGACWDEECLRPESTRFQSVWPALTALDGLSSTAADQMLSSAGFSAFALRTSASSLGDTSTWTYVFVPYCTQDIHLGTCNRSYADPVSGDIRTLRHNGAANVRAAVDWATTNSFPLSSPPDTLAFVGCSAGAAAVIVTEAARAAATYAISGTRVVAVGDSPSNTLTESFVHEGLLKWGVLDSLEELAATTEFSPAPLRSSLLTDAVSAVLNAFPALDLGFYTSIQDTTAGMYWIRMGGVASGASAADAASSWVRNMLAGLERVHHGHDNFHTFVGDIPGHCTMTFDVARTHGAEFDDWLVDLLSGRQATSNYCTGCTVATVEGCDGVTGSGQLEDRCGVCAGQGASCPERTSKVCTCSPRDQASTVAVCNSSGVVDNSGGSRTPTTAGVAYRRWDGIPGTTMDELLSAIHYIVDPPDEFSVYLDAFESPTNICDQCGTVMDAYFRPTTDGDYVFRIAADDNAYLWFGDTVERLIASVPGWTAPRQWGKYTEQVAEPISLSAGEYYYIKAAANEGGGGDNLCVGVTGAMGDLLPIPVTQSDGTVLLFHATDTAADVGILIPPSDCADVDLSTLFPGLSCAVAVNALGCDTDLSTVVQGQSGNLAAMCPV